MFKLAQPYLIRTISSLHCGSGNDLGIIDLPIQREKHTSFPKVESSSLKGALREAFETTKDSVKENMLNELIKNNGTISLNDFESAVDETKKKILNYDQSIHLVFGYDDSYVDASIKDFFKNDKEFAGALGFSDARLLFFPVKSAKGVFAWITCPFVLDRFKEDMALCNTTIAFSTPQVALGNCLTTANNKISVNGNIVLEEYTFTENQGDLFPELFKLFPEVADLKDKIAVLNDDDFKDFVNLSTEVITRTKIDNETGTVAKGALFNEEYLPSESLLYFMTFASPIFQKDDKPKGVFKSNGKKEEELVLEFFHKGLPSVFQLGGNATIGKGIVKVNQLGGK